MSAAEKPPTYDELVEVISALPPLPAKWEGADYLKRLNESTEARLRAVEQELADRTAAFAASQLDVSRVGQERDELQTMTTTLTGALLAAREDLATTRRERDEAQHELEHKQFALGMAATRLAHWKEQAGHWRTQHDLAQAELESARQELARLRGGAA